MQAMRMCQVIVDEVDEDGVLGPGILEIQFSELGEATTQNPYPVPPPPCLQLRSCHI